jgi:hypothetical protein
MSLKFGTHRSNMRESDIQGSSGSRAGALGQPVEADLLAQRKKELQEKALALQ